MVASDTRDPQFESLHRQSFLYKLYFNNRKNENREKDARKGPPLKNPCRNLSGSGYLGLGPERRVWAATECTLPPSPGLFLSRLCFAPKKQIIEKGSKILFPVDLMAKQRKCVWVCVCGCAWVWVCMRACVCGCACMSVSAWIGIRPN